MPRRTRSWLLRRQLVNALRTARRYRQRPEAGPTREVFVLSAGRDGSTLLQSYLNALPGVHIAGEVLNADVRFGLPFRGVPRALALAHLRNSVRLRPGPLRGAKLCFYQLHERGIELAHLRANFPDARFLVIYRRHVGEQYVSLRIAKETRQWQLHDEEPRREARVRIDPELARRYYAALRRSYQQALSDPWLGSRATIVCYEDLVGDPDALFTRQILPFLELEPAPLRTRLRRQNPRSLREKVENYAAVREVLEGSEAQQHYPPGGLAPASGAGYRERSGPTSYTSKISSGSPDSQR